MGQRETDAMGHAMRAYSRVEAVEFGVAANEAEGLEVSPLFK